MREEELNIRSSNKTIMLDGTEQQVLVRYYNDTQTKCVKIVEIINGSEPVGNACSVEVRQSLCRQKNLTNSKKITNTAGGPPNDRF